MPDHSEQVPGYRQIRMSPPTAPVAALADEDAWRARDAYPDLMGVGGAVFGPAREREEGGWEILSYLSGQTPQDARDSLASHFRRLAREAEEAGDGAARAECATAYELLDWEPVDELTVLGTRYRVVRGERFVRSGPAGPEPPRLSDPDPAAPGRGHRADDPVLGFVLDTAAATGLSEGILKTELLSLVRAPGSVPDDMRDDSVRAALSHPGGVLLPAEFMVAERVDGCWAPLTNGCATPQSARDALTTHLRVMAPVMRGLDAREREEYARAADRFDEERGAALRVADRLFRVVRVERLVRIGPDGPEGPRPSDPDPQPPVMVHDRQLREQGLITDEEEDAEEDGALPEPLQEVRELLELAELERERRRRDGASGSS
ncbi:DUF5954 family protein [Streptomyces huiliensis]|uniref:DUF5954 family protein n=1 Tax=Streptomyces huiliensis TaxID=2876027 RepID=UPI001CBB0661|nr:DUF5954 family protein [Streptomyces huiliensis]MBZ4322532.1 DUF5954 family protein [Streptomyces huiliensis]